MHIGTWFTNKKQIMRSPLAASFKNIHFYIPIGVLN